MPRRRRTAQPEAEPSVFTNEPVPMVVTTQSEEAFFDGVKRKLRARDAGRSEGSTTTLSFASPEVLMVVLTPRRLALLQMVRRLGTVESIEILAATLHRDRSAVSKDLKALVNAGLLRIEEVAHAGHGRRSEITAVAPVVRIELSI